MPETWTWAHDAHGKGETLKRQNAHRGKFQKPINQLSVTINAFTKLNVRVTVGSADYHTKWRNEPSATCISKTLGDQLFSSLYTLLKEKSVFIHQSFVLGCWSLVFFLYFHFIIRVLGVKKNSLWKVICVTCVVFHVLLFEWLSQSDDYETLMVFSNSVRTCQVDVTAFPFWNEATETQV